MKKNVIPWLLLFSWLTGALFYGYDFLVRASTNALSYLMIHHLNFSALQVSVIGSAFYWLYLIAQIPAGMAVDRFGVKRLLLFATFLMTAGTLLFSQSEDFYYLLTARAIMGFGGGFAFVCALKLAANHFKPRYFPVFAGFTQLIGYVGAASSGTPLALLVSHNNWHTVFAIISLIGLVLFGLTMLFVQRSQWRNNRKKEPKPEALPVILKQLLKICINRQMLINGFYCCLVMGTTAAFSALWGISYLTVVKHESNTIAATASSLVFLGVALTSPIWGAIATWFDSNKKPLVIAALLGAINATLLLYVNLGTTATLIMCFLFGAFQSVHVLNFSIVRNIVNKAYLGTALAFMNMLTVMGGALLQPLAGTLMDYKERSSHISSFAYTAADYQVGLSIIPIAFVLAFVLSLLIREKTKKH